MKHKPKDIQYCERLFQSFYEIGSTPQGGVTKTWLYGDGGRDA